MKCNIDENIKYTGVMFDEKRMICMLCGASVSYGQKICTVCRVEIWWHSTWTDELDLELNPNAPGQGDR